MSQVTEVNKYFRNHHAPGALLSNVPGSVKPQLPADTRWNSQLTCVETYIKNRPYMMLVLASSNDVIEPRIINLIQIVGLFNEVKHLHKQLSPVALALDKVQSDKCSLADACEY